jgi:diacylglycerol kinase (CTP)
MEQTVTTTRSELHLARKIWHMSTVSIMALVYIFLPLKVSLACLLAGLVFFVPLDFFRAYSPGLNQALIKLMKPVMRDSEMSSIAGTTYLIAGVSVIALFFSKSVNEMSLLFLAFADPIASAVGITWGKTRIFNKSLEGFLAAVVVCTAIAFGYTALVPSLTDHRILFCILAGFIGGISELVQIKGIDDNFSMPILSAAGITVLTIYL